MTQTLQGIASITDLGVIRAQGEDAASFLHGQLTQDVALLPAGQARLAAYCSAKGRMLASFIVLKLAADDLLLICSRDLLPATLKRLSMFVLRAKVRLSDASADWQLHGLAGSAVPAADAAPWSVTAHADGWAIQLYPAQSTPRALWVAPASGAPATPQLDADCWRWSEVASGIATLSQPLQELFVPQMLNYESVGGVNFKKGCYPGQEVVARSQFRGTLKRRAFIATCGAPVQAGQEIFSPEDAEQAVGTVVQAAKDEQGQYWALISMQLQATAQALHVGSVQGPALQLQPLPYALLEDI